MGFKTFAVVLSLAGAARAAAPAADLAPGRYALPVKGMTCAVSSRAIAAEWTKLPEVEKSEVDFDAGRAVVTVRAKRTLKMAALRKALARAEKLANLGEHFELGDVQLLP